MTLIDKRLRQLLFIIMLIFILLTFSPETSLVFLYKGRKKKQRASCVPFCIPFNSLLDQQTLE